MSRRLSNVTRVGVALAMMVLTPLMLGDGRLDPNLACSAEESPTCVREMDSVCALGEPVWNYYARSSR